jgi:hypothetical protein
LSGQPDGPGRALPDEARPEEHARNTASILPRTGTDSNSTAGGWEPSNTHPSNTKVVASCLDTLYLGYRGSIPLDIARELESKRALLLAQDEAAHAAWEDGAESEVRLAGTSFVLRPSALHGYRYRLFNADLTLMVNPSPPSSVPVVMAQLRSDFLWRVGWREAAALTGNIARALLDAATAEQPPIVSRLDMCADFQSWIPCGADLDRFVCRARYRAAHHNGLDLTGFSFGRGVIVARLYDKTAELTKSGKDWMHAVWQAGGYDPSSSVWRLECQLRREALRELQLPTLPDLERRLASLWRYLLAHWLRLTVPVRSDRPERWPTDPVWQILSQPDFCSVGEEVVRLRKLGADLDRIVCGLLGYLSSYAALKGQKSLSTSMRSAERAIKRRVYQHGQPFPEIVEQKRRRLATVEPLDSSRDVGRGGA